MSGKQREMRFLKSSDGQQCQFVLRNQIQQDRSVHGVELRDDHWPLVTVKSQAALKGGYGEVVYSNNVLKQRRRYRDREATGRG